MIKQKRVAVVSGGSSGLGLQILRELHHQGFECFNIDCKPCIEFPTIVADLSDIDQTHDAIQEVLGHCGGQVDVLVNNLGVNKIVPFEDITSEEFDQIYALNAKATLFLAQGFLPSLKTSKGTILNIISNASEVPFTNSSLYNSSKAAQKMITLQLGHESWRKGWGVTVFGISPNKLEGPKDPEHKQPDESGMSTYILNAVSEANGWTPEQTTKYQLTSLPSGKETSVHALAEYIGFILGHKSRHEFFNKTVMPYGA
jgi:NAD(P)-dependent dehydrogenase (short-subunit alcohol dehydrogenase family)